MKKMCIRDRVETPCEWTVDSQGINPGIRLIRILKDLGMQLSLFGVLAMNKNEFIFSESSKYYQRITPKKSGEPRSTFFLRLWKKKYSSFEAFF